ncbi:MAG: iron-containing alcohol dehydrogenase [Alphaproteobacteria bacterium]|nr:iron-containing alcohol dehydrogenase [Alphaproteobacteria bacterium]
MARVGEYRFIAQERVIFGRPAAEAVVDEAERRGAERVFLVASKTLSQATDAVDRIRSALGGKAVGLFDQTVAHVPRESVLALAEAVKSAAPDLIVTIGGGTPIDSVKVALVALAENIQTVEAFDNYHIRVSPEGQVHAPAVAGPPMRQIIVPTTLSGAEFSNLGAAIDQRSETKHLYTGREIGGDAVILDPDITVHTPEWLWLSTGMRAVDHAVESLCSKAPQPFTDATSARGLAMLATSLRQNREAPDDLDARLESQMGVWLATTGLGRIPWGASHGIGHQLGAVAGVPHGHCSCVMLPSVLRYNYEVNADQQKMVASAMDRRDLEAGDAVAELVDDLGQPGTLREVGVTRDHFEAIIEGSLTNLFVSQNPRKITAGDQINEILEMAW